MVTKWVGGGDRAWGTGEAHATSLGRFGWWCVWEQGLGLGSEVSILLGLSRGSQWRAGYGGPLGPSLF